MAKKKQMSQVQKDYNKQRKRLENVIKKAEKEDYIFSEKALPTVPKKITQASVNRLAKITPKEIREKANFVLHETGEVVPVKGNKKAIQVDLQWRKENENLAPQPVQQETDDYPQFGKLVIANFKSYILGFPKSISEMVIPLVNTLITEQGEENVAMALQSMPLQFHEYLQRHAYDSDGAVEDFATSLIEYIPEASDQYKKDLMDRFEFNELGYALEDETT